MQKKKQKKTENIFKVSKSTNGKTMILSKCAICSAKKNQDLLKTKKQKDY